MECVATLISFNNQHFFTRGLCYLIIPHAAATTLRGINMRIAHNFGKRHGMDTCIRHDTKTKGMDYFERHTNSYLWTFVRDPTRRALSSIGSKLSNKLIKSSRHNFLTGNETNLTLLAPSALDMLLTDTNILNGILSEGRAGFQNQLMMQKYIPHNILNKPDTPKTIDTAAASHFVKKVSTRCRHLAITSRLRGTNPTHFASIIFR